MKCLSTKLSMLHALLPVLATFFALGLTSLAPASAVPIILNASQTAHAGDVIYLQGDSFGSNPLVCFSWNSVAWTYIPTISHANNLVTFRMQSDTSNLLTVRVSADGGNTWSAPYFINRAHAMSFDTPEVSASSSFRIFGRNLYVYGTPTVRFVDQATQVSLPATVNLTGSTAYVLNVVAPASIVNGHTYDIYVDGGLDGNGTYGTGETKADEPLLGRNYGTGASDVWNLGVPWGADLSAHSTNVYNVKTDSRLTLHAVGNGVNNDQPAIQAALDAARYAGGGVVYLPAGTYTVPGIVTPNPPHDPYVSGLMLWSNVVLQGAGMGQTTVQYGFPNQDSLSGTNIQFFGLSLGNGWDTLTGMGVVDLTIQNVDATGQWSDNLFVQSNPINHGGQVSTELFLQRVKVLAKVGNVLWTGGVTKMAVENCDFEVVGGYTDAWLGAGSNSIFRGNTVHWSGGGAVSFGYTPDIIVENNHFIRDCNYALYQNVINTRCFDTAFNKNLVIQNNTFDVINGPPANNNDGETISSEGSANTASDEDTGTVTSATATSLTDTTKNWKIPTGSNDFRSLTTCFSSIAVVAIVSGTGTGEWQPIIPSTSTNTLTVPSAWTVTPDSTSKYAITDWACENWLISGNTLNNTRIGIQLFFCSSHDTAIVGNTLTNSNGIMIQPYEGATPGTIHSFTPVWNDQIIGNTVTDTNGNEPAFIGVSSIEMNALTNQGTSVIGAEIRGNTVTGMGATFVQNGNPYTYPTTEGYFSEYSIGSNQNPGTIFTDYNVPAILGTIFQGNTANNCNTSTTPVYPPYFATNGAFRVDSGSYQTVLQDNIVGVAGTFLEDDLIPTFSHTSRLTYGSSAGQGNNWLDVDIGGPGLAGSASLTNGVFMVKGGGIGIGGGPDQFNYCYQTMTGNGTITARVTAEGNTSQYARAGVMIRHTLDPMSMYYATQLYPNYPSPGLVTVGAQCRYTDGGGDGGAGIRGAIPYWIRVSRSGNTLTCSAAPDNFGVPGTWTAVGGTTLNYTVDQNLDIGLGITANNNGALNTATIDHVTVTSP